jgi:hypothetical protein
MRTEYVDQGHFVNQQVLRPGAARNRLRWLPGQYYIDPVTGQYVWGRGGLHWVPEAGPSRVEVQRVYVPQMVQRQVAETSYVQKVVAEQSPVTVTKYVDEVVTQRVPIRVCRMEQVEEVRRVPITVQRPVTERVNYQVAVKKCTWVEQEVVRKVPVTTRRFEYEERVEQTPVNVCRMVTEVRKVREPRTVAKWVPQVTTRYVPRTVVMRVPVEYSSPATIRYYTPSTPIESRSIIVDEPSSTTLRRVETPSDETKVESPTEAKANGNAQAEESPAQTDSTPKDTDPTGQPALPAEPALNGAQGENGEPDGASVEQGNEA